MTSANHNISFSPFRNRTPSWFHWIGIALTFFFCPPSFFFFCSWFCIWFKFAAFLVQFPPARLPVWIQLLDLLSLNAFWTMSCCQGSQRLLIGSVSRSVTNKTLVSIGPLLSSLLLFFKSTSFCSLSADHFYWGWKWVWVDSHSFFLEGIWLFSANNLLPSCGETGNCIRPLGIPTCI